MPRNNPLDGRERRKRSLLAAIDTLPATDMNATRFVSLNLPEPLYPLIVRAAKTRHLSVASFALRSMYAMAAYELGIPVESLLEGDPKVTRNTGSRGVDAEGTRFGSWIIADLVDVEAPDDGLAEE